MKTAEKQALVIDILMKNQGARKESFLNYIFINYDPLCIAILDTKSKFFKPIEHLKFKEEEKLNKWIEDKKAYYQKQEISKQQQHAAKEQEKQYFKPGAILYSSWGYEQTNIDFYIILERKNDFVKIQQIAKNKTYDRNFNDRGNCTADPSNLIGEPFKKKISKYASINLTSYSGALLWDGQPLGWSSYA